MIIMCKLFCMKHLLKYTWAVIAFVLLSTSVSWGGDELTMGDLVQRNDLYYKKFTNVPFTGEISGIQSGNLKNGKMDGEWSKYFDNGQLLSVRNYKDGKLHGLSEDYRRYGEGVQLSETGNYKNGKKEGLWEFFNKDGSLKKTETYEDGELVE